MAEERDYVGHTTGSSGPNPTHVVRASSQEEAERKIRQYTGEKATVTRERGNDRQDRYNRVPD